MPPTAGKESEIDLNDELQSMQDASCFNMFKRKQKKVLRYKEWRVDAVREDDADQMAFLTQQLAKMRRKEEITVTKKAIVRPKTNVQPSTPGARPDKSICAKNTEGPGKEVARPLTGTQSSTQWQSNQAAQMSMSVVGGNPLNMRNRVKQQ